MMQFFVSQDIANSFFPLYFHSVLRWTVIQGLNFFFKRFLLQFKSLQMDFGYFQTRTNEKWTHILTCLKHILMALQSVNVFFGATQ